MTRHEVRPANLLLIEDDHDDQWLVRAAVQRSERVGSLSIVESCNAAFDYLYREKEYDDAEQYPHPDLILLDIDLAGDDGYDVLRTVKTDPGLCGIPVVVFTTTGEEEDVVRSYTLGANSHVTKPDSMEEFHSLFEIIESYWLELVELPTRCD